MANSLCFTLFPSITSSPSKPRIVTGNSAITKVTATINEGLPKLETCRFQSLLVKAAGSDQKTKINSIVCSDCDGNGAVVCSQCKGNGVNSEDHFNGQFKAGGLCWLCRGKKDILCGNCNGAGFVGGFMSTQDS